MEEGMIQAQAMAARAGDGEGAALEMEKHVRSPRCMSRLGLRDSTAAASEAMA